MAESLLSCEGMSRSFGGVQAVDEATLEIPTGTITGLIGPNGAGKSTLVNLLSGHVRPERGRVRFNGAEVTGLPPYRLARAGLIRTFQLSSEFPQMTVLENMLVSPKQVGTAFFPAVFWRRSWRRQEESLVLRACELLKGFELIDLADEYAGNLSGGQKRLLEIARSLMADPALLVLDEPMAGIAGVLIDRLVEHVIELNRSGLSFLIVEHDLEVIERLCPLVYVMSQGAVLAHGSMEQLRQDERVLEAYLD